MTYQTELDMEFALTLAHRRDCACAPYLLARRDVLLPAVEEHAQRVDVDPADDFARFARGVHERHLSGLSLEVSA
ncbi:hypothetical protein ACFJIY_07515 [Pimelobacter simplex]|uniref:hypothetical protein n=1 Tax=Nocardioides simplex TaxID=2045 RepID=UPI00366ACEF5